MTDYDQYDQRDQFDANAQEPSDAASTQSVADLPDPWQGLEVRPRQAEGTTPGEGAIAALNPDDADADSDLVRPARATQFRTQRRAQFSALFPALLLITAGVLLLVRPDVIARRLVIGGALAGLLLSLLLRFFFNGRRERGLFFVTATSIFVIGLIGLVYFGYLDPVQGWPLLVAAPGLAMLVTLILERSHDRGLLLPGLILMVAGGTMLLFTTNILDSSVLPSIAVYWPVLLLLVALAILPRAIRDRAD